MGEYFIDQLSRNHQPAFKEVRGKGLLIGVELKPEAGGARRFCEALRSSGILAKETHAPRHPLCPAVDYRPGHAGLGYPPHP